MHLVDYGAFAVEDVFPLFGPMNTSQKLCIELKGVLPKTLTTDLRISLMTDGNQCIHQINMFKRKGTSLTFLMPSYPYPHLNRAKITLRIENKENVIYETDYLYIRSIDGILSHLMIIETSSFRFSRRIECK